MLLALQAAHEAFGDQPRHPLPGRDQRHFVLSQDLTPTAQTQHADGRLAVQQSREESSVAGKTSLDERVAWPTLFQAQRPGRHTSPGPIAQSDMQSREPQEAPRSSSPQRLLEPFVANSDSGQSA